MGLAAPENYRLKAKKEPILSISLPASVGGVPALVHLGNLVDRVNLGLHIRLLILLGDVVLLDELGALDLA